MESSRGLEGMGSSWGSTLGVVGVVCFKVKGRIVVGDEFGNFSKGNGRSPGTRDFSWGLP